MLNYQPPVSPRRSHEPAIANGRLAKIRATVWLPAFSAWCAFHQFFAAEATAKVVEWFPWPLFILC